MNPFLTLRNVLDEYKRYIKTSYPILDEKLRDQFDKKIQEENLLWKGPYIQIPRPFKKGKNLKELEQENIIHPEIVDFFSDFTYIFSHQEKATRRLNNGKHTIIATGTGSGKTEAFLFPILNYILQHPEKNGTKALLVYPMNALANDQLKRLRQRLRGSNITYGQYTGKTPSNDNSRPIDIPNEERWSRKAIQDNPPDILITNYSMLEYLLIRNMDQKIFKQKNLRFLVMDEIHTYTGARGTEIACLIRRLKEHVGLAKGGLICVGTSATIQREEISEKKINQSRKLVDSGYPAVIKFASNLFGEKFEDDAVIGEEYEDYPELIDPYFPAKPIFEENLLEFDPSDNEQVYNFINKITRLTAESSEQIKEKLYDWLNNNLFLRLLEINFENPVQIDIVADKLSKHSERINSTNKETLFEITLYLILGMLSYKDGKSKFNPKLHMFYRGIADFTRCINCGDILDGGIDICPRCNSKAFPIEICRSCGQHFYRAQIPLVEEGHESQLIFDDGWKSKENTIHFTERFNYSIPTEDIETEESETNNKSNIIDLRHSWSYEPQSGYQGNFSLISICNRCGLISKNQLKRPCTTKSCAEKGGYLTPFSSISGPVRQCPACLGRAGTQEIVTLLSTSTASNVAILTTAILTNIFEEKERKLLIFADNRQDTAYQTGYLKDKHDQFIWRQLIYELVAEFNSKGESMTLEILGERILDKALQKKLEKKPPTSAARNKLVKRLTWEIISEFRKFSQRRVNLEGLGMIEVTYGYQEDLPSNQKFKAILARWNLTEGDLLGFLINFLHEMRGKRAISHPFLKRPVDKQDQEFRELDIKTEQWDYKPIGFSLVNKNITESFIVKSFLNKKGTKTTFQLYSEKILEESNEIDDFIKACVELLIDEEFIETTRIGSSDNYTDAYQVNWRKIQLNLSDPDRIFRCSACQRLYNYNVREKCFTYRCAGTLFPSRLDINNYYFHKYKEIEPIKINPVEHSGQIDNETRETYEEAFKNGDINIIVCTPTMELGVDIGDLSSVILRNIPPSPSHYAQRAGRAGRQAQGSLINVYSQRSPHGAYFYNIPEEMIKGAIRAPFFLLDNKRIIQRHIHSLILERCEKELPRYMGNLIDTNQNIVDIDGLVHEIQSRKEFLCQSILSTFSWDINSGHLSWLNNFFIEDAIDSFENNLLLYLTKWQNQIKRIIEELQKIPRVNLTYPQKRKRNFLEKAYERLTSDENKAYTLSYLSDVGFLPSYAFPGELAILDYLESTMPINRDRKIALYEFAFGNFVYVNGKKLRIQSISIIDPNNLERLDNPLENFYKICTKCSYISFLETDQFCPRCNEELLFCNNANIDAFFGYEKGKITSQEEVRQSEDYNIYNFLLDSYTPSNSERIMFDYQGLKMEYRRNGEIFFVNTGIAEDPSQLGFELCPKCGRWRDFQKTEAWDRKHLREHKCDGKPKKYHLSFKLNTDVLILNVKIPQELENDFEHIVKAPKEEIFLTTLKESLKHGASIFLETEEGEIDGFIRTIPGSNNNEEIHQIVFYDKVPGGAGYLKRIGQNLPQIAKISYNLLKQCECKTSCYQCLRTYYNQREHAKLIKEIIYGFLENLEKQSSLLGNYISSPLSRDVDIVKENETEKKLDREKFYSDKTESPIEKTLLHAIRSLGLPEPEQQFEILKDDDSLLTKPDFAYPQKKIAIYCDGAEFHLERERWEKDRNIDRELILKNWKPLRFTGRQINANPQSCAQSILDLLNL